MTKIHSIHPVEHGGFLNVKTYSVQFEYPNGVISSPTSVDILSSRDAAIIVAYLVKDEEPFIYLRSCIRPGSGLRDYSQSEIPEEDPLNIWELPSGMAEYEEIGIEGLRKTAAREFEEEIGISLPTERFKLLGERSFDCAAQSGRRLFFFRIGITEEEEAGRVNPSTDGSALEQYAQIKLIPLSKLLELIKLGKINDMKSELGVYRLQEALAGNL